MNSQLQPASDVRRDPVGTLYRLDPDLACTPLRNGIIIPNSLAWSPDGRTMYFADTHRRTIWAWDYDPGTGAATHERLTDEELAQQPLAGSVLAVRPGVRGLPESRFAG